MEDRGLFQALDESEARELLQTTTVGRLAFVVDGRQELLPVNFVLHDGFLYVRTARDTVLGRLADGHDAVAFEVDHHDDLLQNGWSVVVHGDVGQVDDPQLVQELSARGRPRPWAPGDRDVVLVIRPHDVTGRRVRQP